MRDREKVEKHPSYGLVSFSRRQGNPGTLFGSALNNHHSFITLSIRQGEKLIDDAGSERFYGQMRDGLVEVVVTHAKAEIDSVLTHNIPQLGAGDDE